jgi:lysophospholipase L1-like esterase
MNDVRATPSLEERLRLLLAPRVFFLGILLGLTLCGVAGRKAANFFGFHNFQRFHSAINPSGHYYPTALQVRALARRELPRDKIAVIVGGSSVMEGIGQPVEELWTRTLQARLGDEYRVLNLAARGGAPNEYGQLAAEMLCRDHPRVIYVCDCLLHTYANAPDGNRVVYRYFFQDARARDLLLPFPERDAALAALAAERKAKDNFGELLLQSGANRWLSFNDLWHVVAYEACFTLWLPRDRGHPWQARKYQPDDPSKLSAFQPGNEFYKSYLGDVVSYVRGVVAPIPEEGWTAFTLTVHRAVPEPLRPKTLAVVNRCTPAALRQLAQENPGFAAKYDQKLQDVVGHLRSSGLKAVVGCTTLDVRDFVDDLHLSSSGGAKLADELAPVIRDMARHLGYEAANYARESRR